MAGHTHHPTREAAVARAKLKLNQVLGLDPIDGVHFQITEHSRGSRRWWNWWSINIHLHDEARKAKAL